MGKGAVAQPGRAVALLGIDVGATGIKVGLFDESGRVLGSAVACGWRACPSPDSEPTASLSIERGASCTP
jgi:hypothetical protein